MAAERSWSTGRSFCRRHASLQYFTSSQLRSHFFRQVIVRPHTTQGFESGALTGATVPFVVVAWRSDQALDRVTWLRSNAQLPCEK